MLDTRLGPRTLSSTFHGRDLFAPVAARLAGGARCEELGRRIDLYQTLQRPEATQTPTGLRGQVLHVDRYGNLITNLAGSALRELAGVGELQFQILGQQIRVLRDHYAEVAPGALVALVGSGGFLELSVREGSAAQQLGAGRGAEINVSTVKSS
ncbi:MAG: SAM-dependent chlorinase/fluorinase [Myxococcales bacterium]